MYRETPPCVTGLVILQRHSRSWLVVLLTKISVLQLHPAQADPRHVHCHCEVQITGLCLRSDLKCQFWSVREREKSGLLIPSPSCWSTVISRMSFTSSATLSLLEKPSSNTFSDLPSTRSGTLNLIGLILWYVQTKGCYKVLSMILTFSPPHVTVSSSMMIISLLVNCLVFLPIPNHLPLLPPTSWNLPDHWEILIHLLWNTLSSLVQYHPRI